MGIKCLLQLTKRSIFLFKEAIYFQLFFCQFWRVSVFFFTNDDCFVDIFSLVKITIKPEDEGTITIPLFKFTRFTVLDSMGDLRISTIAIKIIKKKSLRW